MKKFNPYQYLVKLSFSIFLIWSFSIMTVHAEPETLGEYPVCEPSAVVKVTCSEKKGNCLLVGDNEQNKSLFLYSFSSNALESSVQSELALDKKVSDIEAIAKLENNKVLVFGSHSRNSTCKIKDKRRRFLQAELSANQLQPIGTVVKYPEKDVKLQSKILFDGLDTSNNKILNAVSKAIDQAEEKADQAIDDKTACEDANAFNAEGAVTIPDNSSFKTWIGLRSPLVSLDAKNYAVLLQMANLDSYQFNAAALIDLDGKGIRELTFDNNSIWGIAGGPKDGEDNFVLWKLPSESVKPNAILKPEIVRELPLSSEGLAIIKDTAYVVIDGDTPKDESITKCKTSGQFIQFTLPD